MRPSGEYTLCYSVVDTVPPMIYSLDEVQVERGTEFDVNKVLAYGDNADPTPSFEVDGDVNMEENGSYPLHATVTDASGNKADRKLTVEVVDAVPQYEDDRERTSFADFVQAHKGEGKAFGIDVSEWQGDIDFEKVKKAGCEFVIIRIGYNLDGEFNYDSKFEYNLKAAREAGLKVGLYMFSYDNSADTLKAATNTIVEKLAGEELDLPYRVRLGGLR